MKPKIPLFNPDKEDFTVTYDINGDRKPLSYTIHAGEIEYFDSAIADHLVKHLADFLFHKRGVKLNSEADLEEIKKEIRVEL